MDSLSKSAFIGEVVSFVTEKSSNAVSIVELDTYQLCNETFSARGFRWSVSEIIKKTIDDNLPVFMVPLVSIDLSILPWDVYSLDSFAYHMAAIQNADMSYPIIFDCAGGVCNGYHRILKGVLNQDFDIKAVRLHTMPRHIDTYKNDNDLHGTKKSS